MLRKSIFGGSYFHKRSIFNVLTMMLMPFMGFVSLGIAEESGGGAGLTEGEMKLKEAFEKNQKDTIAKLRADLIKEIKEGNEVGLKGIIDDAMKDIPSLKESEEFTELAQKVTVLTSAMTKDENKEKSLSEVIKESHSAIKAMVNGGKDVEIKALFQRSGVANNTHGRELQGIGQLANRKLTFRDIFAANTFSDVDDNGTIKYIDWDEDSITRAAAAIAEGGTFPASTAAFEMYTTKYKKTGDSINMTEEVIEDEALIARELEGFLATNVEIKEDTDFINGNGTGANLEGIVAQSPAYTPVAAGIQDANIGDLVVKVSESITTNGGSKYAPDFVLMNIADINAYKLHKDANNNYILPNGLLGTDMNIDGVVVVENNAVTANTMVMGDSRYGRIYDKKGYMLSSTNSHDAEFLDDKITLKGRKRSLFLIRHADRGGFAKVTSISAALTTLAS